MEFKGTKAPWTVEFTHIGKKCAYAIKEHNGNAVEDSCNARLIAAAPILLKACEVALVDTVMLATGECELTEDNLKTTIECLDNAIRKAISN